MRPYVPFASFDSLTNKVQGFAWRSPKILIASSRQNLYNTSISSAMRPADYSTLVAVEIDKTGTVAFAVGVDDTKPTRPQKQLSTTQVEGNFFFLFEYNKF